MRVCLFEDRHVLDLEPITWTRPAYELLCGRGPLASKQWRYFAPCERGALVRPYLADLQRAERPDVAVNNLNWLRAGPAILVNSRWLPPSDKLIDLTQPSVALIDEEVAYAILDADQLRDVTLENVDDFLGHWQESLPCHDAGGRLLRFLWEVVDANGGQIENDFVARNPIGTGAFRFEVATVGPREQLCVDPTARVEPMVVADVTNGPVIIDREVVIHAFTRLEGPCYVGPGAHVFGAKIRAGTTLGPCCRIGGEVEASIVQGHSNKYHDGFLGHAYVGEWVNLGAGTSNSDLRNDYGEVKVTVNGRRVATGTNKVGCFLGDHTKSGLGTLLNTGTNVGVFCNLLPAFLLPKHVPSFCQVWNGQLSANDHVEPLLETAETVMRRRGCELTDARARMYREVLNLTREQRQHGIRDAEQRRLRRSA